jgi:branched-chain amino acid transport system substrate-binding protein
MNKKLLLIPLALLLAVSLIAIGCPATEETTQPTQTTKPTQTTAPTPEAKTLRIGMILGITGMFSIREIPDLNQAQVCADMINEQGGITVNGDKYMVELVVADTKSTFDGVTAAANKLVYDEGIKLCIGPTAFFAPAAGAVCDPEKVLRMITWVVHTPGEVDASTPYSFMAGNGSLLTTTAAAKYLKEAYPNVKTVAIVTPDDGAPPFVIPIATKILAAEGISVVGDPVIYPNETQDFSAYVAKLNAIEEADAIFLQNGLVPAMGALVKGLRESGNDKPFAGSLPARISQVMTIAGESAMKDVFSIALTPGDPGMYPIASEIIDRVTAEYGADYQLEMTAPNCLWVLKEAIEACQSLDATDVKNQLESMDEIETIWGPAKICGEQTLGIKHVIASPQTVQILKDGVETSAGWIDLGFIP